MERFGYVFASRMLVDQRLPVRFMYREEASGNDSGWRFFSGLEDQDYVDDPKNIAIYDVETILAIDRSIRPYLSAVPGTAFERKEGSKLFTLVSDYDFTPEEDD